ncbi:MAG: CHAT domain-containing protein [Thiolinea sp.]
MESGAANIPIILLLGAKSSVRPLQAIPRELSRLESRFSQFQHDTHLNTPFEVKYYPYFDQEQLRTQLNRFANRVAILHFAGHSDAEGLLSDDELVYSRHIAGHIKSSWRIPPALIVLNGCHNAGQVKVFHDAGVSVVIATYKAVNDGLAADFARNFYDALLTHPKNTSIQAAFAQSSSNTLLGENRSARSADFGEDDDDEKGGWDWDIFEQEEAQKNWTFHDLITTARPVLDADGRLYNPYKGLEAFQEQDQSWFFGRENLSRELTEILIPKEQPTRFFTLLGASGSGKSSLMNAGVIPRLRESGGHHLILYTRPSETFSVLADLISTRLYPDSVSQQTTEKKALTTLLATGNPVLPDLLQKVLAAGETDYRHAFLFIDQFEELFTHARDKQDSQGRDDVVSTYLQQLLTLIQSDTACTLVLIMRADFLATALTHPQFAREINKNPHELLSPMSEAELRTAIERPAQRQQVELEPSLTENLLNAVEKQAGSLPLLQYALSLLWEEREKRQDRLIRLEDYQAFGGLEKALEQRADSLYQELTAKQQTICQGIFLRLVQPGEGTEDTRRRAGLHEFSSAAEREVIQKLANARLITTQGEESGEVAYAEVSHEALIRHWGLLREWIAANRDEMRVQHQVSDGAKAWEEHGWGKDWLLTGTRLGVAEEWLGKNAERPNQQEAAFVRASSRRQRQNKLVSFAVVGLVFIALIVGILLIGNEQAKTERANEQLGEQIEATEVANLKLAQQVEKTNATNEQLEDQIKKANFNLAKTFEERANAFFDKGIRLEAGAGAPEYTHHLRRALLYTFEAQRQEVPAGRIDIDLATIHRLSQLDARWLSPERLQTPTLNRISAVAYSPDGSTIASGADDNTVRIWDTQTGETIRTLQGHSGAIWSVAYSPDGSTIASGAGDGKVRMWDTETGKNIKTLQGHTASIRSVAYSPDGNTIAASGTNRHLEAYPGVEDHNVRMWDTKTGQVIKTLQGHSGDIWSVAYSPDGSTIAAGAYDGTVRMWDTKTGKTVRTLQGHRERTRSVTYSPDGSNIASGAYDGTVRIWDTKTRQNIKALQGHTSNVLSVAYSPDGSTIASGENDSTVRIWDTKTGQTIKILEGHYYNIDSVVYSPDGSTIASSTPGSTVRIWDTKTGQAIKTLEGNPFGPTPVAYSPDGSTIAFGENDSTVRIWDTKTGKAIRTLQGYSGGVHSVAYSPDGSTLASGEDDSMVRIWDTNTGKAIKTLRGHTARVLSVAYSPDGSTIASGADDSMVRIWDIQTGQAIKTLQGHSGTIWSVAYSPDGSTIAYGAEDSKIRIWDTKTGQTIRILQGHSGSIRSVAYSPDGSTIASGSVDNTIRIWDAEKPYPLSRLLYEFDPIEVADALEFLWNLKLDGLEFVENYPTPALFPQEGGHYITWNDHTRKFIPLLEAPRPDETKMDQLVRWLEDRKAYRKRPVGEPAE